MAEIYGYDTDEFLANLNKQNFDHPSMTQGNNQMSKVNILGNNSSIVNKHTDEEEDAIPHKDFQA